jgi:hypothetical protein
LNDCSFIVGPFYHLFAAFWKKGNAAQSVGALLAAHASARQWYSTLAEVPDGSSTTWHGAKLSFRSQTVVKESTLQIGNTLFGKEKLDQERNRLICEILLLTA